MKKPDRFLKKILEIKEKELKGLNNSEYFKEYAQILSERSVENRRDKKIFKQFCEIAEEHEEEYKGYFSFDFIFKLDLPWKIAIVLGKKNIGKTYSYMQLINKTVSEGRHVVVVRTQHSEITRALEDQFNYDDRINVYVKGRSNTKFDLLHKHRFGDDGKPLKVGFCCSVSNLTSYQGGSYSKVKYVIWDECISDGGKVKLTKDDIRTFERFISSVQRDKHDMRIIIMGNLLAKNAGSVQGDPLLQYYGINPDANLKYIDNTTTDKYKGANLLFLNTKDMFKGIEEQGVLAGADLKINRSLVMNELPPPGEKVVDISFFLKSEPLFTLLFTYNTVLHSLDVATKTINVGDEQSPKWEVWYIVDLRSFDTDTQPQCPVFTNESALYNSFKSSCRLLQEIHWDHYVRKVVRIFQKGKVLMAGVNTDAELKQKIIKHFESYLRGKKETSFERLT